MKQNVYVAGNELTSPIFGRAFAIGCKGIITKKPQPGSWAGFGSPQLWDHMIQSIKNGNDLYFGDHAYFGRGKFYRVTKNRFQHTGIGEPDFKRLKPFWEKPKPWRKGGKNIVICPQTDNHHERYGEPQWLKRVLKQLSACTDRNIIVRKKRDRRPLIADLEQAHCVIVHTSNAAVESVLYGVPAIATGDCAASIMSRSDPFNVEKLIYPEGRHEWAATLAANQWTLEEIKNGDCWRKIK